MTATLAEMYIANNGRPIEVDGKAVVMAHGVDVASGQELKIEFIQAIGANRQGIALSLDNRKGLLEINGDKVHAPVLWTDTAPQTVVVKCYPYRKQGQLNIWNVWKCSTVQDRTDAWIGNAGMIVAKLDEHHYEMMCGNGIGDVNFSDLRFRLTVSDQLQEKHTS